MNTNNKLQSDCKAKVPPKKKNVVDWYVEDAFMPKCDSSSLLDFCVQFAQKVLLSPDDPDQENTMPNHARNAKQ